VQRGAASCLGKASRAKRRLVPDLREGRVNLKEKKKSQRWGGLKPFGRQLEGKTGNRARAT